MHKGQPEFKKNVMLIYKYQESVHSRNNSIMFARPSISHPVFKLINVFISTARVKGIVALIAFLFFAAVSSHAQTTTNTQESFTLGQCIDYAFSHQQNLQQNLLGESIAKTSNIINLSPWMPQMGVNGNFEHYFQLPTSILTLNGEPEAIKTGVVNTFIPQLYVNQNIISSTLLYAAKTAKLNVQQAREVTDSTKIFIVASVSKSFYNLLLTLEQIDILKEDTARLDRNLSDAYHQYVGGIVDQTDYKEAAITLNNSKAQLKQALENVAPQYAALKQAIGYPPDKQFNVSYDTTQMLMDISFDTTLQLKFENRIEYQEFVTSKALQHQMVNYYKYQFIPTLSAFYNYNYEYENDEFSKLLDIAYPNSLFGLSLNFPLFTGLSRIEGIRRAKMQERQIDWYGSALKSEIYTEYASALANYKSNLFDFYEMGDNVNMAKDVYSVVSLQYKQGIVPYLNVITAESDLITSEIGYLNALFQVLSSKIDLQKSMGIITYNR